MSPDPHDSTPAVQPATPPARSGWLAQQWALWRQPPLASGWASLRGAGHSVNQDAVLAAAPLFAVADGVGGGKAGELASSQLLDWCRGLPPAAWQDPAALAEQLRQADAALARRLAAFHTGGPSATTFAGAWLRPDGSGHIAHVGDVRILHWRHTAQGIAVATLTEDQTYAALGEREPPGGSPGDPARMLGVGAVGQPPVQAVALQPGDGLLLCSDGFHRFVDTAAVAAQLGQPDTPLARHAEALAQAALRLGSRDDVSVLLVLRNPGGGARWPYWLALGLAVLVALAMALTSVLMPAWRAPAGSALVPSAAPAASAVSAVSEVSAASAASAAAGTAASASSAAASMSALPPAAASATNAASAASARAKPAASAARPPRITVFEAPARALP